MRWFLSLLMVVFSLTAGENKSEIHLNIAQGGLLSTKIIYHVLGSMGFKVDMRRCSSIDGAVEMDLILAGKRPFDPTRFMEILDEHQIRGDSGEIKSKQLTIGLDASTAFWHLPAINEDEGAQLERTSLPYWFAVDKAHAISIEPPYGNKWYPEIAVFDNNMQVLASFRELKPKDHMSFKLPDHAVYLKISNANGMKMLKEGMWVESANDEQ